MDNADLSTDIREGMDQLFAYLVECGRENEGAFISPEDIDMLQSYMGWVDATIRSLTEANDGHRETVKKMAGAARANKDRWRKTLEDLRSDIGLSWPHDPETTPAAVVPATGAQITQAEVDIRQMLVDNAAPVSMSQIHRSLGGRGWILSAALRNLIDDGVVERTGRGGRVEPYAYGLRAVANASR